METCSILALLFLVSLSTTVNSIIVQPGCDFFKGNWVLDNSYPLYESTQCPFIATAFECQKFGRPDNEYEKYRWQPDGCLLPRFDGPGFLRKLKGKRLIFVGDSLSLNQWQSLTCMLHVSLPHASYTLQTINGVSNFTFTGYDVSLLFSRNAFLVDLAEEPRGRVLRLDSISSSRIWGQMDVMIFDTWHWWFHNGRKQPWDWVVHGNTTVKDMDRMVAYEKALLTWSKWIDTNVHQNEKQVFFQGVSPDHASGNLNCQGKTNPLKLPGGPHPGEVVLERVLRGMGQSVHLLNITTLSQFRIDGHPSIYGNQGHRGMDCTHWCLSGVPDTWNQFLYAMLS